MPLTLPQASTALIVSNLAVLLTWLMRALGHAEGSSEGPDTDGGRGSQRKQMTSLRFWSRNQSAPIVLTGLSAGGTTMMDVHTRPSVESAERPPTDVEDGRSRKSFNMTFGKAV